MRTPTYIPRVRLILLWPSPLPYSDAHKDCIDRRDDPATYTDMLARAINPSYYGPYTLEDHISSGNLVSCIALPLCVQILMYEDSTDAKRLLGQTDR